jgi:hypothetical protein
MMQFNFNQEALVMLIIFVATQTGALIYFAGVIAATMRDHEARLTKNEATDEKLLLLVAQLATREGIQI